MKNNNKIYITLLIFALASLFLIVFFVWPTFQDIEQSSADLISAKNDIVTLSAQTTETENFKKDYEKYKPNLEKIDQLFVDLGNPVDFIKFLEDTATACQVSSQISLPPSAQNSQQTNQNYIIFQFSSNGSFAEMADFLKKIEAGPYLLEIENLTIKNSDVQSSKKSATSNSDSARLVDATFTIKVFTKQ